MTSFIFPSNFIIIALLTLTAIGLIGIPWLLYKQHNPNSDYDDFVNTHIFTAFSGLITSSIFLIVVLLLFCDSVGTIINNRNNESILFQQYQINQQTLQEQINASQEAINPDLMTSIRNFNSNLTRIQQAQKTTPINFTGHYNWLEINCVSTTPVTPTLTIKNGD